MCILLCTLHLVGGCIEYHQRPVCRAGQQGIARGAEPYSSAGFAMQLHLAFTICRILAIFADAHLTGNKPSCDQTLCRVKTTVLQVELAILSIQIRRSTLAVGRRTDVLAETLNSPWAAQAARRKHSELLPLIFTKYRCPCRSAEAL